MYKWTFELEVITPMFLSGAVINDSELRPPSIKNLMRFWYRACYDTSKLSESSEKRIYGSTENQGKFKPIILNRTNLPSKEFIKYNFLKGVQYFGFPFGMGENQRKYIEPTTTENKAKINLSLKYVGNSDEEKKAILGSLWLLIWLGGLGTRNRKGFGSLQCIKEPSEDTFGLKFCFTGEISDFKDFFQKNLRLAVFWINPKYCQPNELPSHTSLVSDKSKIHLLIENIENRDFKAWEEALNFAGDSIQNYRNDNRTPDYEAVKNVILSGNTGNKKLFKPAGGLPIKYQYRSLFRQYFIKEFKNILQKKGRNIPQYFELKEIARKARGKKERKEGQIKSNSLGITSYEYYQLIDEANNNSTATVNIGYQSEKIDKNDSDDGKKAPDRRASPLFIKIVKFKDDKYGVLFSFLPAKLLPDNKNYKIKITADNNNFDFVDAPDFSSVEKFLQTLPTRIEILDELF